MNEVSQQIIAAEREIEAAGHMVSLRDKLARLNQNQDFKDLINDEYLTKEAVRCIGMSADMSMDTKQRADHLAMAQATGHLRRWFVAINQMGAVAEKSISQHSELLDELRGVEDSQEQD